MAQMAVPQAVDFSGVWVLRTSENLDKYLTAEKWSFFMKKAAKLATAKQTIEQTDKSIKVKVKNPKGVYEYEAILDGATEANYTDMDKEEVVSTAKWRDDKLAIIETMTKGKDKKEYVTTRYMENNEMRLKIINKNHKNGEYVIRIFKRE